MSNTDKVEARNDVAAVLGFMLIVNITIYQITWVYAGPITALSATVLITILNHRRGVNWRDLGLKRPRKIWLTLLQALVVFAGTIIAVYAATLITEQFFEEPESLNARFGDMEGNLQLYLWWVLLSWVVGGFSEEMIFRGFLLTRVEAMIKSRWASTTLAIVFQAAVFASVHLYYQGAYGALQLFPAAIFIGICYVLFGRNLWPLILAHGTMNTLGFLGNYLGDSAI